MTFVTMLADSSLAPCMRRLAERNVFLLIYTSVPLSLSYSFTKTVEASAAELGRARAKYLLLLRAMEADPFNSDHFAWIDPAVPERCGLEGCAMIPVGSRIRLRIESPGSACTAFVCGPRLKMRGFCERMLERDCAATDYHEHPGEYEPYYGGAQDVLAGARYNPSGLLEVFGCLAQAECGSVQEAHILDFLRVRRNRR